MFGFANRSANQVCTLERPQAAVPITPAWDRVIVLANRAPFRHERAPGGAVVIKHSASGLVTALEPLVEMHQGTWVAHAAGNADHLAVDARGGVNVPPANSRYRVRYVNVPDAEHRGYYYGFANEGLWPLCHNVDVAPIFRAEDFAAYSAANHRFARAVADESGVGSPLVLVQDYHFALAPRVLRHRLPSSTVVAFWHIPWPRVRTFRTCPWARELVAGLLGSDIIGFQTDDDCRNFLGCAEALADADVDAGQGTIRYQGRSIAVRAYPVGVDWRHEQLRATPSPAMCRGRILRDLGLPDDVQLGIGIDRLDYTKGIHEKFMAIERLLETHRDMRERFAFVQIAEPSRDCLPAYRAARAQLLATSERVNARFGTPSSPCIRLIEEHHEPVDVYRYYRAADFCYVGSLHDGMNLVAKEFVSAREDERGVLVLSEFAGAARQLRAALLVNPYRVDRSAETLAQAIRMPAVEQAKRMRVLRANVEGFDATWWGQQMIADATRIGATRAVQKNGGRTAPGRVRCSAEPAAQMAPGRDTVDGLYCT
jgi:trehalose 6-phosphate synthase